MNAKQQGLSQTEQTEQVVRIFTDGAGARPDGKGSGFGYLRPESGQNQVIREDGLTNNQAEYKGILLALETLPAGSIVQICTDSELICAQLNGRYHVRDPKLALLWTTVQDVIRQKSLRVNFVWVRREENLAGKLF